MVIKHLSGLDRPRRVIRKREADPSRGGTRGYSLQSRNYQLNNRHQAVASERSLRRWANRLEPFRMTGNHSYHKK